MSDDVKPDETQAADTTTYEPGGAPHMDPAEEQEWAHIYPERGKEAETAQALLDAAERPEDVQYSGEGFFRVPAELADKAEAALPSTAGQATEQPDSPAGTDDNADGEVDDIESMTNEQMQAELRAGEQPTSGNKKELQARLREYRTAQAEAASQPAPGQQAPADDASTGAHVAQ
jgi:hypothetical protein